MFLLFLLLCPDVGRHGNLSRALVLALAPVPVARAAGHALGAPAPAITDAADCCERAPTDDRRCLLACFLGLGLPTALLLKRRGCADLAPAHEAHGVDIDRGGTRAKES